MLMFSIPLC